MRVVENFEELSSLLPPAEGSALTVGVFDGVHVGHQKLIQMTVDAARSRALRSVVVTFVEHPLALLAPPYSPQRLLLPERKEQFLREMGVDFMVRVHFTRRFASQTPGEFVEQVLVGKCRARVVVCGHDFAFGRAGGGDVALLRDYGARHGFEVLELGEVVVHGTLVKSTLLRDLVSAGEVDKAAMLLTRPYELKGRVVSGFGRGRKLGFPTANLDLLPEYVLPAQGVYVCAASIEQSGALYPAMVNIGFNPTFGLERMAVEAHLLGFEGELGGRQMHLFFLQRLRDECKFESVQALIEQLRRDKQRAQELLAEEEAQQWMREIGRMIASQGGGV